MRGFKASILIIILTAATCMFLIGAVKVRKHDVYTINDKINENKDMKQETKNEKVLEEGTFPGYINYEYVDNNGIYHIKYNDRKEIYLYDKNTGKSDILVTTTKSKNSIHAFAKDNGYIVWEEDSGLLNDSEKLHNISDWELYLKKDTMIMKVDEGKPMKVDTDIVISLPTECISICGDYFVYKTYDNIPGTSETGAVIKLYDIKKERSRTIFSLIDIKNTYVSSPNIYKDYIVWSTARKNLDSERLEESNIYVYNIKYNAYSMVEGGHGLKDPMMWEDYVVCSSINTDKPSISLLNIKTGEKKDIASSDYSLKPRKEITDFSLGHGYVTWNTSYADSVQVYDIINDKVIELKKSNSEAGACNKLLNIKIFEKTLLYTDHVFNTKNGKTVSEVNRYIILE